jgi:glycine/D-amino acid oxidase-like deaminating enzyme
VPCPPSLRRQANDTRRLRPSRLTMALLTLASAGAVLLTGCSVFSPSTTSVDAGYGAGVTTVVGSVQARNLVVVGEKGAEGLLSGALVNDGPGTQTVTVQTEEQPQPVKIEVAAGALVTLGADGSGATVVVGELKQSPGTSIQVTVSTPTGGSVQSLVPVVAPTREYASVTPTPN